MKEREFFTNTGAENETQGVSGDNSATREIKLTLTVIEAAQLLGVGRMAVYGLIDANLLRCVRVGRKFLIPRDAIPEFLNRATN